MYRMYIHLNTHKNKANTQHIPSKHPNFDKAVHHVLTIMAKSFSNFRFIWFQQIWLLSCVIRRTSNDIEIQRAFRHKMEDIAQSWWLTTNDIMIWKSLVLVWCKISSIIDYIMQQRNNSNKEFIRLIIIHRIVYDSFMV